MKTQDLERGTSTTPAVKILDSPLRRRWMNPGDLSNLLSFMLLVLGLVLRLGLKSSTEESTTLIPRLILAAGLFGFAGGVTNTLAIKMLFDPIRGLKGSGIIPGRFREIRQSVKDTIMVTFFDKGFLESYVGDREKWKTEWLPQLRMNERLTEALTDDAGVERVTKALTELALKPEGAMLQMLLPMCGGIPGLVPMLQPLLVAFGTQVGLRVVTCITMLEYLKYWTHDRWPITL